MSSCTTCHRDLRPDEQHRTACTRCEHRIRAWLREIPHQLVLLEASLERDTTPRTGHTHHSHTNAPLPLREDVLTLLGPAAPGPVHDPHHDQTGPTPLTAVIRTWAQLLADERGKPLPQPHPTQGYTRYLTAGLPYALTRPWIADLHQELDDLIRRARNITRTQPQRHHQDAPCPGCNAFALFEEDWQPYIDCENCGLLLTPTEYADHARRVLPSLYRTALLITVQQHQDTT